MRSRVFQLTLVCLLSIGLAGCHRKEVAELKALQAAMEVQQLNLSKMDDFNSNVFSGQRWELLGKSHAQNVVVHWPDGRTTNELGQHEQDLRAIFEWAPDTRITDHTVRVANGDWTAVTGIMEGTFTQPMTMPDGKNIPPTGKRYSLPVATFAHWKDRVMDEKHIYYDNDALFTQLGVASDEGTYEDPFPDAK